MHDTGITPIFGVNNTYNVNTSKNITEPIENEEALVSLSAKGMSNSDIDNITADDVTSIIDSIYDNEEIYAAYQNNGSTQYKDKNGNLIRVENNIQAAWGMLEEHRQEDYIYSTDENGKTVQSGMRYSVNGKTEYTEEYSYDEQGRKIEIFRTNDDGSCEFTSLQYDDNDNIFTKYSARLNSI